MTAELNKNEIMIELRNLDYYYKRHGDRGDLNRAEPYKRLIKQVPELKQLWEKYRKAKALVEQKFEDEFKKIMHKYIGK